MLKTTFLPTHLYLTLNLNVMPLECRDKIWHPKTRIMGLPYGEEIMQWRREGICGPGKRLCCRPPPPSGIFRNLKRYISGVHFQKFSNVSVFFTVNISIFFHIQRCPGVGVPHAPGPSNQISNWYSYGYKETTVWTVNSTLSWGVYNIAYPALPQWNFGLGWSIVIAKNWESAYT